ncbi:MAG TPA: endolytic transglycosylase MltG [Rhizomicrobium sp.]|nr:endolytic transglycosylase MltG [Rhizomicrobium sp.]
MRKLLLFLVVVALLGAGAFYAEQWNFLRPGPAAQHGQATVVLISPGDHSATIAEKLQKAGVVENADLFRLGVRVRREQSALKAGEFAIPSHASMADIMGILIAGKSIQHKITAAEGLTSDMIYKIVAKNPVLTGDAGPEPAEGTLLPETYLFTRGMTRAHMLMLMKMKQEKLIAKLWPARASNLPVKTKGQAVILASIVEKETAIPEERRHIASVFVNRLRLGMKLQSDPTIIYGITKGYPLGRGIRQSELNRATPYNTYAITGLPPTPIANPGKDAIAAVLQPEDTKDLYFVANGKGGHVFAATIAEHEKNVAKWRQVEHQLPQQSAAAPATPGLTLRGTSDTEKPIETAPITAEVQSELPKVEVASASSKPARHRHLRHHRRSRF